MKILSIDHMQLAMPAGGETKARAFYGTLLGIPEVAKPPHLASRGGCWFERGTLKITWASRRIFAQRARRILHSSSSTSTHSSTHCGARAPQPKGEAPEGARRVHVDDPFGNRLELMEPTGARG